MNEYRALIRAGAGSQWLTLPALPSFAAAYDWLDACGYRIIGPVIRSK